AGLEDVIAARSGVCTIDGGAGRLYYRGYEIGDLAGAVPFEDVTRLLWDGELPTAAEARAFRTQLAEARVLPAPLVALLRGLPRECHPLDALRTAVSAAAALDPDTASNEEAANRRKAFRLMTLIRPWWPPGIACVRGGSRRRRRPSDPTPPGSSRCSKAGSRRPTWRACSTSSSRCTPIMSSTPRRSRCGSRWPRVPTCTRRS